MRVVSKGAAVAATFLSFLGYFWRMWASFCSIKAIAALRSLSSLLYLQTGKKRLKLECSRGQEYPDGSHSAHFFTAKDLSAEKLKIYRDDDKKRKLTRMFYHLFIEESSDESDLRAAISLIEQKDAHMRQK